MPKTKKIACQIGTLRGISKQSAESTWELARKSDSNSSSPGNRGSFADTDQSVDNIIKGIEKGANKAKMPDDSKDDDDDVSGNSSETA